MFQLAHKILESLPMIVQKAVMFTGFKAVAVGVAVDEGANVAVGSGVSVGGMGEGVNCRRERRRSGSTPTQ